VVNLSSWPAYLKSRGYALSDLPRTARHLSRGLTYPLTLAQFLLVPTQYELTEDGSSAFAGTSRPSVPWAGAGRANASHRAAAGCGGTQPCRTGC